MNDIPIWWWRESGEIAKICCEKFPDYTQEIIEQAKLVASNTFLFNEKWEMESTQKPVKFSERIEWEKAPDDDPEWIYALNRHTCFLNLGKAYLLTGDIRWCQKFVELLQDWIERVPLTKESMQTSWRTIEAGLRCENWLKTYCCFRDCSVFTDKVLEQFCASLRTHGEYLYSVDDDFRTLSNWGVLQNHGLFLLGVFLQEPRYINQALERLTRELSIQILPDGVQWEQSPMYHCEVLHCYLDTVLIARRNCIPLPKKFTETVHHMTCTLAAWCKPNGCLPCQSDSDEIDARDLLLQGALLFDDGVLKHWAGSDIFIENLWNIGEAVKSYGELKERLPERVSNALTESGNYILRSSSDPDSEYIRFHCGCIGSGHGHADLLHIDLYSHGEDILIDTGRYTYVNSPLRRQLKQPSAHNTVRIDGMDFSGVKNSWDYSHIAMPIKGEYRFGEFAEFISGGHLGYSELTGGSVFVNRKIVWVKPDIIVVCDEFYGLGSHTYEQYFHFGDWGNVTLNPGGAEYCGKKAKAKFFFLTPQVQSEKLDNNFSKNYNQLEKGICIRNTCKSEGFTSLLTVICTAGAEENIEFAAEEIPVFLTRNEQRLNAKQAQAVRICCDSKEAVVLMCHQEVIAEVGLIRAGNYKGYGKTIVFSPENPHGECLQW